MNNPLVSIIIPVYNAEKYLEETINSAIDQTWTNKEIIIVDDGSTDSSLTIANSFKNAIVKIFTQENKGASAARNKGIQEAKGDYIQFLDADDLLPKNKIETQLQILIYHQNAIIGCNWIRFKKSINNTFGPQVPDEDIKIIRSPADWLLRHPTMVLHAWLIPNSLINKSIYWNERISNNDDGEYFYRVISKAQSILFCNNVVVYYRTENPAGLSAMNSFEKYLSAFNAAVIYKQTLLKVVGDNNATKIAIGNNFKELIYAAFPNFPKIVKLCNTQPEVKYANLTYNAGGRFAKILSKLLGWQIVSLLKFIKIRLKLS